MRNRNTTQKDFTMTKCSKGGVKIRDNGNSYSADPFAGVNPFNNKEEKQFTGVQYNQNSYDRLDLNIDAYSREDLFKLFGLQNMALSEDIMKECRKTVLKTHPDKSRLDERYFIFFSKAYKKLLAIYEFQNKTNSKKEVNTDAYFDSDNTILLDHLFEKKTDFKNPKNFNSWFNEQFEKQKLEDPADSGYGNWLKSDEDIMFTPNVTKNNLDSEIEKRKKQVQSLITYNGVNDTTSNSFGGSSLMAYDSNFSSGSLFSNEGMGYTDLRQAYVESVIPVTEDDFNKMQKYKSIDDYKRHREGLDITPLSKEEAMRQLYNQNKQKDEESAALAFYYAQQSEKIKQNNETFWSGLKNLTNW